MPTGATHEHPDCLPATWLAERLGTSPARVDALRRAGELIGVRPAGSIEWLYPAWQLDGWRPRPGIPRVVAAARDAGIGEERLYEILTAPLGLSGPRRGRLADLLAEGRVDDVVTAVRAG